MGISSRDVTIEKVRQAELGTLGKIFAKAFGDEVDPGHITHRIRRVRQFYYLLRPLARVSPWVKDLFNIYIIKLRGEVAGFLQVSYLNRQQLHLDYIAIGMRYRGQGLGTWALRRLTEKVAAKGDMDVVLEVRADNDAYRLYRRMGFRKETGILHYKKNFAATDIAAVPPRIAGLRKLKDSDLPRLYDLYVNSVPEHIRQVIRREYRHFYPSLFVRHLEWLKNRLMRSKKREYVVETGGVLQAYLEIMSYPKVNSHTVSLMLRQDQEALRAPVMRWALAVLQQRYPYGTVSTTIYDDNSRKQQTLKRLGFAGDGIYYVMVRPAGVVREQKHAYKQPAVFREGSRAAAWPK